MKLSTCACGRRVTPPKRKCMRCLNTSKFSTTTLRASTRGRNKVGIAAHKPDKPHTRKAKRQNPPSGGPKPVTSYKWSHT